MDISTGTVFGPYRVLEKIGAGGMGEVYRALDTRLEREVALKLVSESFLASETGAASPTPSGTPHSRAQLSHTRFLREARAAATLNHPNICAIHDVGEQDGRPYLVMELLHGETLKAFLGHHHSSAAEVIAFGQQAASALAAAHVKGIVHRDIKPANLFIVESGRERRQLKVLDFGLAKKQGPEASPDSRFFGYAGEAETATGGATDLTIPGSTVGTAAYMSPEQAKGDPLDARTDLFSLGSVLYEMATGQPAFGGRSTAEVFAALLMKDSAPVSSINPAMPAALDPIIAKLLVKDREQRYESAEDLLADLEALQGSSSPRSASSPDVRVASGTSIPAAGASGSSAAVPVAETSSSRNLWIGIGAAVLALLAVVGFLLRGHFTGKPQPDSIAVLDATSAGAKPKSLKDAIIVADFINKTGDAIFDSTLDQALRVQLAQSPVLDIVSQQHLRQSLQYLGRKQDETVTPQIAREIGEREGIKAILTGSIAPLGKAYLLTLSAQNTASGDDIASEEATAPDKEHVLDALNQVTTAMRAKLGESLSSIQRLNAPFGQATTPSLEAFRAYALGDEAHQKGNDIPEAFDHYKRAVELDPKLAMAWARMGVLYLNSGQVTKASEYFTRAYGLSGNVSEREKLYIAGHYYSSVIGDLRKSIETLQVATEEYPLQIDNFINLGVFYIQNGEIEKSAAANRKALQLQPDDAIALENGVAAATTLNQVAEAEGYLADVKRLGLNGTSMRVIEMTYYAFRGNWGNVQQIVTETAGRPDQFTVTATLGSLYPQLGEIQLAKATYLRAADQAASAKASDSQAGSLLSAAGAGWMVDECFDAGGVAKHALQLDSGKVTQIAAAVTMAQCNDKGVLPMLAALEKRYPQDTVIQEIVLPPSRGWLAFKAGDAKQAVVYLEQARAHDDASVGPYVRGLAYLQLKDSANAIVSFQKATHSKGVAYTVGSPYALSYLGLGRAYAMAGDKVDAKKAYDVFLSEWKNADANLPVVAEAKKEYSQL